MKKSELRQMIREMLQEELAGQLTEKLEGPSYAIKAWDSPEAKTSGSPSFDSASKGIKYPEFEDVLKALQSSELSGLGAYEITWIKSGTEVK